MSTHARNQVGKTTYYPKRNSRDSQLDIEKSIAQQFDLLRIVDNDNYPAFFVLHNNEFVLRVYKRHLTEQ
jgi:methionyl-tRNA formyltransferase